MRCRILAESMSSSLGDRRPFALMPYISSGEKGRRGVAGGFRGSAWSNVSRPWTTEGKPIDPCASSGRWVGEGPVVIDPSLLRVLDIKEPGDASKGNSSWVPVLVCALLLLLSMVLSSSGLDTDAEASRLRCEGLVRPDWRTGEWTRLGSAESPRNVVYVPESGVAARIVLWSWSSNILPCLSCEEAWRLDRRWTFCGLDLDWVVAFCPSSRSLDFIVP